LRPNRRLHRCPSICPVLRHELRPERPLGPSCFFSASLPAGRRQRASHRHICEKSPSPKQDELGERHAQNGAWSWRPIGPRRPTFRCSGYLFPASCCFNGRLPFADGRFPWVARRRTNIGCPRDRALLRSRTAILYCCAAARPKATESSKTFLFLAMSVAISPRLDLCRSAATTPRRLGFRP
jgi:hypothetical protein